MNIKLFFYMAALVVPCHVLSYAHEVELNTKSYGEKWDKFIGLINHIVGKKKYKKMLINRSKFMSIYLGDTIQGKRVGRYSIDGAHYSLKDLMKHKSSISNENMALVLQIVLDDIITTSLKYVEDAKGSKSILEKLIECSCLKHKHVKSPLLRWAATKDGDEEPQMRRDLKTLDDCYLFTVSLIHFLDDMLASCKKGKHEYEQYIASRKKNN